MHHGITGHDIPRGHVPRMTRFQEVETDAVTLLQLTTELSLPTQGVAVAANNRMIPRTEWADYALSEGISIVIIKAACGG